MTVEEWAGHSADVLLKTCAQCREGLDRDTARVDADTVRQLGADLAELLTAMMADPGRPVGKLLAQRPQDG